MATHTLVDIGVETRGVQDDRRVTAETFLGGDGVVRTGRMYRPGHYGIALLFSTPAYVLGPLSGMAFSLFALATSMFPDLDTRTERVRHRGETHTVAFALFVATCGGLLAGVGWLAIRTVAPASLSFAVDGTAIRLPTELPVTTAALFVGFASFVGICSHLVADALNPGYGTNAIAPLWPVSRRVVRLGVARVDSPVWNWGLLVAGLLAQLGALLLVA